MVWSICMGKYKGSIHEDSSLNHIANELAEVNALKRLDLKSRPNNHKAYLDIIEDLEDQA